MGLIVLFPSVNYISLSIFFFVDELELNMLDQVVFSLEKVHIIWEPLLMPSTYRKSMCSVLESVFLRITRDILFLDDMAADETLQV